LIISGVDSVVHSEQICALLDVAGFTPTGPCQPIWQSRQPVAVAKAWRGLSMLYATAAHNRGGEMEGEKKIEHRATAEPACVAAARGEKSI